MKIRAETVDHQRNAVADELSHGDRVLVGRPSRSAVRAIMSAYGFEVERVSNWQALVRDNPNFDNVADYASGERITERYVRTS